MSCLVFLLRLSWWLFFLFFYSLKQSLKHGVWQLLLRAAPPMLGIWPCNSISPIQDLLICWFQAPPMNLTQGKKSESTNNKPPGPIHISGQSRAGFRLCRGFCQPHRMSKNAEPQLFCGTCGANFYWSYCASVLVEMLVDYLVVILLQGFLSLLVIESSCTIIYLFIYWTIIKCFLILCISCKKFSSTYLTLFDLCLSLVSLSVVWSLMCFF